MASGGWERYWCFGSGDIFASVGLREEAEAGGSDSVCRSMVG